VKAPVRFTHRFVEYIPERPEPGMLYVSVPYATVVHRCGCGCGCGNKVVTPLSPFDWKLAFDGESISLYPSVGNFSSPCRSHCWIRGGRAHWVTSRVSTPTSLDRVGASGRAMPGAAPGPMPVTGAHIGHRGLVRLLRRLLPR